MIFKVAQPFICLPECNFWIKGIFDISVQMDKVNHPQRARKNQAKEEENKDAAEQLWQEDHYQG